MNHAIPKPPGFLHQLNNICLRANSTEKFIVHAQQNKANFLAGYQQGHFLVSSWDLHTHVKVIMSYLQ